MRTMIILAVLLVPLQASAAADVDVKDDPGYQYKPNSYCGTCHQEQLSDYSQSMMGRTPHDQVFQQFYQ